MKKDDVLKKDFIDELLSKSSKRNFLNSMTIRDSNFLFWRPNNYRRQVRVKSKLNSIGKTTIAKSLNGSIASHTKILSLKGYSSNVTVQFGKDKLTAIWSQNLIAGEKEVFKIKKESFNSFLLSKKSEIMVYLDGLLNDFCVRFNYSMVDDIKWSRHEDWIRGDDFVDKIPREVIIHDTMFKKVYAEGIEAVGGLGVEPTDRIRLYIRNRMLEDDLSVKRGLLAVFDELLALPFSKQVEAVKLFNERVGLL